MSDLHPDPLDQPEPIAVKIENPLLEQLQIITNLLIDIHQQAELQRKALDYIYQDMVKERPPPRW